MRGGSYFQKRFSDLIKNPFDLQSKTGLNNLSLLEFIPPITKEERCLDLGCGPGLGTWLIGQRAGYSLGIDLDKEAIEFANKHYATPGKIEFKCCNLVDLNETSPYDRIIMVHTLEHLRKKDAKKLLLLLRELLSSSGFIHISVPLEASLISRYARTMEIVKRIPRWDPTHQANYTIRGLFRLFKSCGYEVVALKRKFYPSRKLNNFLNKHPVPSLVADALSIECILSLKKKVDKKQCLS